MSKNDPTFTDTMRANREARADFHSRYFFAGDVPTWNWPATVGRVRINKAITTEPVTALASNTTEANR